MANYALKDKLVVFGVIPNSPETGYGYIKSKHALNEFNKSASEIEKFIGFQIKKITLY